MSMSEKVPIQLLVTDVDNTLYDWVRSWAACTRLMIEALEQALRMPALAVERRIKEVHTAWGATECPACLRAFGENGVDRDVMASLTRAYDRQFVACAPVFTGIHEALARVRQRGARIAMYTESPGSFAARRLALLGLDASFDALYARAEEECWSGDAARLRCVAVPVGRGRLKPDPRVLHTIAAEAQVPLERVLYVGDNPWKDIAMARSAGVHAAWARYGTARRPEDEALLARLCHWTPEQVSGERAASVSVSADVVLERHFGELFDHFSFTRQ
jgi:phosphoglycolate phosphatase